MNKERIIRKRAVKWYKVIHLCSCLALMKCYSTIVERDILEKLHHNFIVNLRYAFQDDNVRSPPLGATNISRD